MIRWRLVFQAVLLVIHREQNLREWLVYQSISWSVRIGLAGLVMPLLHSNTVVVVSGMVQ